MIEFFMDFVTMIIQFILNVIGLVLNMVSILLPNSPFSENVAVISDSNVSVFLGFMNHIIPFSDILKLLNAWVLCVGSVYLIIVALRYFKIID